MTKLQKKLVRDLELCRDAIAHWRRLLNCLTPADYEAEGWTTESCSFCRRYHIQYRATDIVPCDGCPVKRVSGRAFCNNTPHGNASRGIWDFLGGTSRGRRPLRQIRREIKFLQHVRATVVRDLREVTPKDPPC